MKRRTFIHTTGLIGLNASLPWPNLMAQSEQAAFLQEKSSYRMLFPRPLDGTAIDISPVGLAWLPCPGADSYRVEIYDAGGAKVYEQSGIAEPVHLPDRVFPAGTYTWDVIALDEQGGALDARGRRSYTILPNAHELPWIEPKELLSRVPQGHSRVLYPQANLEAIRATLNRSRSQSWALCRRAAERALDKGAPEFPTYHQIDDPGTRRLEYGRYFSYFRGFVDGALMDLSLAYLMTEDEKYARAAKEILLPIAEWPTDDDDVTSVSARWGDEVGLSFSKCAHLAYDWLYHSFTQDERDKVFTMCRERAGQTLRRLQRRTFLTTPGSSHDGRLIAYLSDMSMAMAGEAEEAEEWLTYSLKALTTFYPHWGTMDGGWAEGIPYGLWYNSFYIPAFQSLEQLADYNMWKRPFYRKIRYFFFYCTANHGEIRPFGDSAEKGGPGVNRGSGYAQLMAFHAHRYNDPYIGWWVKQIPGYRGGSSDKTALVYEDDVPAIAPSDIPQSKVFPHVGWAGLHSDLTQPEEDLTLIFKSSPFGSVSHSHADQNAFAIMKGGTALAIPSGYYGPSYGKPHHAEWTRSTKANNCILVNGEGQQIRVPKGGRITGFEEAKSFTYVSGDATDAYAGKLNRWIRHIILLRPGIILLLDEIEAPAPSQFQWMLHAFDEMELNKNKIISKRKNAKMTVSLACAQGLTLSQTNQFDTPYNHGIPEKYHEEKAKHWHVTAETQENASRTRIAAIMAVSKMEDEGAVQLHDEDGWFGVEANGVFRDVLGWVHYGAGQRVPDRLASEVDDPVLLWGRGYDGEQVKING